MEPLVHTGLALIGFLSGTLLFSRVGHWLLALRQIVKSPSSANGRAKGGQLALATIFGSGPWLLLAAAAFVAYAFTEPWARWLLGGGAAAVLVFAVISVHLALRARRKPDPSTTSGSDAPRPLPRFIRFALWIKPRKWLFLTMHGVLFAVAETVVVAFIPELRGAPRILLFMAVGGFLGGLAMGWYFWKFYIWPVFTAFPEHPYLPPSMRPFENAQRSETEP